MSYVEASNEFRFRDDAHSHLLEESASCGDSPS